MDYMHRKSPSITINGLQHRTKLMSIDRFGDTNRVNLRNFNAMTLKFL